MADMELVEVTLGKHGFSFHVVRVPDEEIDDKLALASSETGLICRMEYQNFLFNEFVINLERLFHYFAETAGGDPAEQIELRNLAEAEIYKVNPGLDPESLIITKNGLIKRSGTGTALTKNPDWGRVLSDVNPYIVVEEVEILDAPPDYIPKMPEEPPTFVPEGNFETVVCNWPRTNLDLSVRKFSPNDLPYVFGMEVSFRKKLHYQIHIIQKCIEKADAVFHLCDAMGITTETQIPVLAEELYQICIEVNPFLAYEEIDLEKLKSASKRTAKRRKSSSTKKAGSGKLFSEVTGTELLTLSTRMKSKIVGQDEAIDRIVDTIQIASCGLRDPESPIAAYLLCGTTGVGKTLCAKVLAEELCGSRDNIVRIDCSEYTQQHDIQKLIGAPPSYVGYEDGGFLTNAIQTNPFSVVLFDEIEKAHNKLFDILLQVMDDARLTDGKGNVTKFNDCILLMTSNIGVAEAEQVKSTMGFGDGGLLTEDRRGEALKKALKSRFRPEFLNRIDDTINFRSLTKDDAMGVVDLLLAKVQEYLEPKAIKATFTKNLKEMIFEKGFSKKFGARPLQRVIDREIIRPLAKRLLEERIKDGARIKIDYKKDKVSVREIKARVTKTKAAPVTTKA
jgi:hypothetical protein